MAANLESEGEGKAAKKKKKKPAAKEGSDAVEEKAAAAVEPEPPKPQAAEPIKTQGKELNCLVCQSFFIPQTAD